MKKGKLCYGKSKTLARCQEWDVCQSCATFLSNTAEDTYFYATPIGPCVRDDNGIQMSAAEIIEKMRQMQMNEIQIIAINPKDSELIDLNKLTGDVYVVEGNCIERGTAAIFMNELKDMVWKNICEGRMSYKRGWKWRKIE